MSHEFKLLICVFSYFVTAYAVFAAGSLPVVEYHYSKLIVPLAMIASFVKLCLYFYRTTISNYYYKILNHAKRLVYFAIVMSIAFEAFLWFMQILYI